MSSYSKMTDRKKQRYPKYEVDVTDNKNGAQEA